MTNDTELQEINMSIEQAKDYIDFAESENELSSNNKHFEKVIIDGYMRDEAARLAGMLAEPTMADEVNQRELMSAIKAIGHLRQYLINIRRTGLMMKESLLDAEAAREEVLAES